MKGLLSLDRKANDLIVKEMRILFESLKNILSDVNFKADASGLKLTTIDGTQNAIVNLFLVNEKFEEYICTNPVNIGINLLSVFKILKGIKHTDTISFTIYESEDSNMYIESQNSDKKSTITSKIKLLRCKFWVGHVKVKELLQGYPSLNIQRLICGWSTCLLINYERITTNSVTQAYRFKYYGYRYLVICI